jgi:hypothetical protein
MKSLFFALVFLSAGGAAADVSFKCEFSDLTYLNQFSLEVRNLAVEDGRFSNASFDFSLRKRGAESRVERLSVTRDGTVQVFEAGTIHTGKTLRVASFLKGDEVEYINLLVDVPPRHSSQLRMADGLIYFGSCKSR